MMYRSHWKSILNKTVSTKVTMTWSYGRFISSLSKM